MRQHEISRLEAFSDAVFGFALALLAVSADPPGSYGELVDRMVGGVSFACCFALLVWMWYEHHLFFRRYGLQDGPTIVLNSILLFLVLLYVYPLKFRFDSLFARPFARLHAPEPMQLTALANAAAIYSAGFIAIFLLFALLYRRAVAPRGTESLGARSVRCAHRRTTSPHQRRSWLALLRRGIPLSSPIGADRANPVLPDGPLPLHLRLTVGEAATSARTTSGGTVAPDGRMIPSAFLAGSCSHAQR